MPCSPDDDSNGRPVPFEAGNWRRHMEDHEPIRRSPNPPHRHRTCTTLAAAGLALAVVTFVLVLQTRAERFADRREEREARQAQEETNVKLIARLNNLEVHPRAGNTTKP
jgi:C4-dicarboxylate-specific signal transduction histidine kinase